MAIGRWQFVGGSWSEEEEGRRSGYHTKSKKTRQCGELLGISGTLHRIRPLLHFTESIPLKTAGVPFCSGLRFASPHRVPVKGAPIQETQSKRRGTGICIGRIHV